MKARQAGGILALAALARLACALTSLGFEHPNEPFRLLEPVAALSGYSATLPWEWERGLLSELPARLHLLLLQAVPAPPLHQLMTLKLLYALLSLLPVWAAFRWAKTLGTEERESIAAAWIAAAIVALWPELIYHSVRLMDYSIEAALLAGALLLLTPDPCAGRSFGAGALLGVAFFFRFQSGVHLIGITLALGWMLRARKAPLRHAAIVIGSLVLGYGTSVLTGAFIELRLSTRPESRLLGPFLEYWHYNWVEGGASRDYGVDPWHRYVTDSAKYWGWTGAAAGLLALGWLFSRGTRSTPARIRARWGATALIAFVPVLIHSAIGHKEARFLFGSQWLWAIPVSAALARLALLRSRPLLILIASLAALGWIVSAIRVSGRWFLHSRDVRQIAAAGQELPADARRVVIHGDPLARPAGFLLRTQAELCYSGAHRPLYLCSPGRPEPEYHLRRGAQGWHLTH